VLIPLRFWTVLYDCTPPNEGVHESKCLPSFRGPNGAGKTTFAREFLPNYADCKNFINADLIAQGVSPFSPETAAFPGRAAHAGRDRLLCKGAARPSASRQLFRGRSYLGLVRRLKRQGYEAHFFYLWVPSAELAPFENQGAGVAGGP